jgi:hypothetical protein
MLSRSGEACGERITMRLATKSGIALIILSIGILGWWSWWKNTRNFVPVNTPISLAAGQDVRSQFKLNFDGLYLIEIEAPKSLLPAIDADWTLSSRGSQVKSGSAKGSQAVSAEPDAPVRVIGQFQGRAGEDYALRVSLVSNEAAAFSAANTRLKVTVASIAYTDLQSAAVLVFSMAFICLLFGMILLAIAFHASRKATVSQSKS